MKRVLLLVAFCALALPLCALEKAQGYCERGGFGVIVPGTSGSGTQTFQRSFVACTLRVYLHNTVTLATLYADDNSTPLPNPFTANADGSYLFYAANGSYDIMFSGGGIAVPFTTFDVRLGWFESVVTSNVTSKFPVIDLRAYCSNVACSGDQSAAFTAWLANAHNADADLYCPVGTFFTNAQVITSDTGHSALMHGGGAAQGPSGCRIVLNSASADALLRFVGINSWVIENISFDANNLAPYAVHWTNTDLSTPTDYSSAHVTWRDNNFSGGTAAAFAVCDNPSFGNGQNSEGNFIANQFSSGTGATYAFKFLCGGNTKNFRFFGDGFNSNFTASGMLLDGNGRVDLYGAHFGNVKPNGGIMLNADNPLTINVFGGSSEDQHIVLYNAGFSSNPCKFNMTGFEFEGSAPVADSILMISGCNMTLIGNNLKNTGSTEPPWIKLNSATPDDTGPSTLVSMNNTYMNATVAKAFGYVPVQDCCGRKTFDPSNAFNALHPTTITSTGDSTSDFNGVFAQLNNVTTVSEIRSMAGNTNPLIANTGMIRLSRASPGQCWLDSDNTNNVCDYMGHGVPTAGLCTINSTGSTWRRDDGGVGTSFYVCENNAGTPTWTGK